MDFGKLPNVEHVRFDLPPEDPKSTSVLASSQAPVQVYVGAPVWTCPKWVGTVYPKGIVSRDYLQAYGRQFNSIELNSTFYRIPDKEQIQSWKSVVPKDFRFFPKLHQEISHAKDFASARRQLKVFWESVSMFEETLGTCFLQLPPHFDIQLGGALKWLLNEFPEPQKLAIEFRHPSWFAQRKIRPDVFDFLQARGISTVITDVAGRRDVLHSSLTTQRVLIRFTGNELHPTDYSRLEAWVERLAVWIGLGLREIYFFIHQPTEAEVPELAKEFIQKMNQRCGLSIRCWEPVSGTQMSLF